MGAAADGSQRHLNMWQAVPDIAAEAPATNTPPQVAVDQSAAATAACPVNNFKITRNDFQAVCTSHMKEYLLRQANKV
jgi:hypothetical protein